jgi:hypothetical protein
MKKQLKIYLFCLGLCLLLPCSVSAEDSQRGELDTLIEQFMTEHGLNEDNFAMGFMSTGGGEAFYYNGDKLMPGGSIYKLPLNMVYADRLRDGICSPDELVGGYTIERAMYCSIVCSDNDVSYAMQKHLFGGRADYHDDYRRLIAQYSGLDPDELGESYFRDNCFSPRYMINTLSYLYDHADGYAYVIDLMKQAHPGRYFRLYEGDYEIAHKYGYYEGALNDCAIVYTPTPFLLTAFTKDIANAEQALGELCSLMTDYALTLSFDAPDSPEEAPEPAASACPAVSPAAQEAPGPSSAAANTPEPAAVSPLPSPEPELPVSGDGQQARAAVIAVCAAAVCVLAAALAVKRLRRGRHGPQL